MTGRATSAEMTDAVHRGPASLLATALIFTGFCVTISGEDSVHDLRPWLGGVAPSLVDLAPVLQLFMPAVVTLWVMIFIGPMPAVSYVLRRVFARPGGPVRMSPSVADATGWLAGTAALFVLFPVAFGSSPDSTWLWVVGLPAIGAYLLALPISALPRPEKSSYLTRLFAATLFTISLVLLVARAVIDVVTTSTG